MNGLIPLHCNVCGSDNLDRRITGMKTVEESLPIAAADEAAVYVHPDADEYESPLGTRGGYVKISYVCPRGHDTALIIANHKGQEYAGWLDE